MKKRVNRLKWVLVLVIVFAVVFVPNVWGAIPADSESECSRDTVENDCGSSGYCNKWECVVGTCQRVKANEGETCTVDAGTGTCVGFKCEISGGEGSEQGGSEQGGSEQGGGTTACHCTGAGVKYPYCHESGKMRYDRGSCNTCGDCSAWGSGARCINREDVEEAGCTASAGFSGSGSEGGGPSGGSDPSAPCQSPCSTYPCVLESSGFTLNKCNLQVGDIAAQVGFDDKPEFIGKVVIDLGFFFDGPGNDLKYSELKWVSSNTYLYVYPAEINGEEASPPSPGDTSGIRIGDLRTIWGGPNSQNSVVQVNIGKDDYSMYKYVILESDGGGGGSANPVFIETLCTFDNGCVGTDFKLGCEVLGYEWMGDGEEEPDGTCCGDTNEDCGEIFEDKHLCTMNELLSEEGEKIENNAIVYDSSDDPGDIVQSNCNVQQYLATTNAWIDCDNDWKTIVNNHEYLCAKETFESIATNQCTGNSCSCCNDQESCESNGCTFSFGTCKPNTCEQMWLEYGSPGDASICAFIGGCPSGSFALGTTNDCKAGCCATAPGSPCTFGDSDGVGGEIVPEYVIYECVGGEGSISHTAGEVRFAGQSVTTESRTFYCSSLARWVEDLDNDPETCEIAGFTYTGNRCCGDSKGEYYNDLEGGCWNGSVVLNNTLVVNNTNPTQPGVLFFDGRFRGCNLNEELAGFTEVGSSDPLIEESGSCNIYNGWFCSARGTWNRTLGLNRSHLSVIPWDNESQQKEECCQPGECWYGDQCVLNQGNDPNAEPLFEDYRCGDGEWANATIKFDWNKDRQGYCARESMCLVNPNGLSSKNSMPDEFVFQNGDNPNHPENMQCISDGQFILDHYCLDGSWTSRTKILAIEMLELGEFDYTLHCDDYTNSVNKHDYFFIRKIEDLLGDDDSGCFFDAPVPCTNKLCVMKLPDEKVVLGASLNLPINDTSRYSFLHVLGKEEEDVDYCNNVGSENQFYKCKENDIWYNPVTQSVIYSKEGIVVGLNPFDDAIKNIFTGIINFVKGIWNPDYQDSSVSIDISFLEGTEDFERVYLSRQEGIHIQGIIEEVIGSETFMAIRYDGLNENVCSSVELYNIKEPGYLQPPFPSRRERNEIVCDSGDEDVYTVFSVKGNQFPWVGDLAWDDLTVKIRAENIGPLDECSDGTEHASCSLNRPLFCNNGNLVERCTICGCELGVCQSDGSCDESSSGGGDDPPEPLAVCGNTIVEGSEECDLGESNGIECIPDYDDDCGYCGEDCSNNIVLGRFCGDNNCDPEEDNLNCASDCV